MRGASICTPLFGFRLSSNSLILETALEVISQIQLAGGYLWQSYAGWLHGGDTV